jgi:ankyrin repeat protein
VIKNENASLEMIKVFVEMGVKANQPDALNQTALYYASRDGHNKVMEYLVSQGCNVNHIDTYGQTPIFYAAREGHLETV